MAALPTDPINLMDPYATASSSPRRDWVLLHPSARTSDLHNATTVVSRTRDGQPVVASFWLVDPPGVSYFSVHCPGLKVSDPDDFAHDDDPDTGLIGADVVCADAALLLFCVSFNTPDADGPYPESTHHFVYRAGPGEPALHLLPDPDVPSYEALPQFGILPCGKHYAVAFLRWNKTMGDHMFDVHVFSSQTKAWSRKVASLAISESDKRCFRRHDPSKQITIGSSSLGWVDLLRGILLLRTPFDEHPVIEYISFPASRPPCSELSDDDDEQGGSDAPQYFRDVACCNDLIKFVDVEYHDPYSCRPCCGRDKSWKATIWSRKLSWGDWRRGFTVDVADISLDQSYSALLPELWDDETDKLHLKKLIFYTPTLGICDDDLLFVMSKVNDEDDKAWVITVDMKHAVAQAAAPFSAGDFDLLPMYRPCSFPKYLNMTPGVDITNTGHKYFTRMDDVEKCIGELLWTQDWLRKLGQCLEHERSAYIDCSSLHLRPVSSLRLTTPAVVEYASYVGEGKAKAASKAVDVCLRALEDFNNLLLRKLPSDASTSTKAMRRKINTALKALNNVLQIAPQSMMVGGTTMDGVTTLANACHQNRRKPVFERRERPGHTIEYIQPGFSGGKLFFDPRRKAGHEEDKCDDEHQVELDLHGSLGPWLRSLPPDVWLILAIAFSALVLYACDKGHVW
ncbi:hypothetical protein ZWY2020_044854 [Hordeum vulgare]|nr:hypothetical protein ZWY2020_044854 [Hordeum vulgare]